MKYLKRFNEEYIPKPPVYKDSLNIKNNDSNCKNCGSNSDMPCKYCRYTGIDCRNCGSSDIKNGKCQHCLTSINSYKDKMNRLVSDRKSQIEPKLRLRPSL